MFDQRQRRWVSVLAGVGVVFGSLCFASSASAFCASVIYDYVPGLHAIYCDYGYGPEETWTVPAKITKPRFRVQGADHAVGGAGGLVEAKLAVKAGEILDLKMGTDGTASSVSRDGEALLVAGGGNGKKPNFVAAAADLLKAEEPGLPAGKFLGDGSVFIEWYDARDPFELTEPLDHVILDFFGVEDLFFHTGLRQEWTVPEGVDHALFELFGGEGESGEPRGHIFAGLEVEPGESFSIFVGGPGEDTTLVRNESFDVGVAAGGDTERPNYFPWMASPAEEFWEGGGPESEASNGFAIVHSYPPEGPPEPQPEGESDTGPKVEDPLPPTLKSAHEPAPPCVVPRLKGLTIRAARNVLSRANCKPGKVRRRTDRRRKRSRVVAQNPPAGTVGEAGTQVTVVVGASKTRPA